MSEEEFSAYNAGAEAAATGHMRNDEYSDDWSIQREYENGFHGRPRWY